MIDDVEYFACVLCPASVPEDNARMIEGYVICQTCGDRIDRMSEATIAMEAAMEVENA